jgi:transposase
MRKKVYSVALSADERMRLHELTKKGKVSARKLARAHTLLASHDGKTDAEIAETLHVCISTVEGVRKRFVQEGLDAALNERPRPGAQPRLNGKQEAFLVALACSAAPEGREHWTMQLLADRLVQLEVVDSISDETVRRVLKKGTLSRG